MRIILSYEDTKNTTIRRDTLVFNPDALHWEKNKKDCWNLKLDRTGLSSAFASVFIKRWCAGMAPAHKLFLAAQGKELAGTPRILGAGQEGQDWFYVIERLPDAYILLSTLLEKADAHRWLTAKTLERLVEASTVCFRAIGRFDHIYTDLCSKNFMVNPNTEDVKLIDLDSAWSYEYLLKRKGTPSGDFERQYWCLWHDYVLQKHSGRPIPEHVPITMVLSLAGVWAHGLGVVKKSSHKQSEVLEFLLHTSHDIQRPLFEALENNRKYAFLEYFGLDDQADKLFEEWRDIFRELTSGRFVNWSEVRQVITDLTGHYQQHIPFLKKSSIPPSTSWTTTSPIDPYDILRRQTPKRPVIQPPPPQSPTPPPPPQVVDPFIDLTPPTVNAPKRPFFRKLAWDIAEGVGHGIIDPLGILSRNGILKRKSPYQ